MGGYRPGHHRSFVACCAHSGAPPRWPRFLLQFTWDSPGSGDQTRAAPLILTYAYYWYNFMPLARGTAACGYATLLSLFWAAGMPVTASIPKDYQVGSRV